jgi:acetylornithine deacetylase/succinyl-diaminopimelate desuccinylase-like protein
MACVSTKSSRARGIVDAIHAEREEVAELTLKLSALPDLSGYERPVAEAVLDWLRANDIDGSLQVISATSANVLATIGPAGDPVPALILSSHLDTEGALPQGSEVERRRLRGAWRDGDLLIGKGLVNDKTQLAAMLVALRALARCDPSLSRAVQFLGTAQECGAPVDPDLPARRDEGPHMGEGFGARWAIDRGVLGAFALIGEPTGFAICGAQAGYLRVRIVVPGFIPYTPFVERGDEAGATSNPFERAGLVIGRLVAWARAYEQRERVDFWGGTIAPKAQIQDVRRTTPLFTEQSDDCDVFVDIRTAPGSDDGALLRELAGLLADLPFACSLVPYDRKRGYVATGAEPVVEALERAHREVFGTPSPRPREPQVSMWHDTNAFNEVGIPAVSYGIAPQPETFTRERFRSARVDDVVRLAQVYALAALDLCGRSPNDRDAAPASDW